MLSDRAQDRGQECEWCEHRRLVREEWERDMAMDLDVDGASTGTTQTVEEPKEEEEDVLASSSNSLRLRHLIEAPPLLLPLRP